MNKKQKISGCFISHNVANVLPKFMESIRDIVDEIIIVDGFSTDNTVSMARKYGAKVFQRKFDDFSSMRNYSLEKASYTWRFLLDFDEILSPKFHLILPKLYNAKSTDCFKVRIFHYRAEDNKLMTTGWKRVLVKDYAIFWGEIHERTVSLRHEIKIHNPEIYINEYKTADDRLKNYIKYKKILIDLYKKYKKTNQPLLMNKIANSLIPDHNSQLKIEVEKNKWPEVLITQSELLS